MFRVLVLKASQILTHLTNFRWEEVKYKGGEEREGEGRERELRNDRQHASKALNNLLAQKNILHPVNRAFGENIPVIKT